MTVNLTLKTHQRDPCLCHMVSMLLPEPKKKTQGPIVDGRNPANQLRLVVFPIISRVSYGKYTIIFKVLYIPGGWPWDF